MNKILRLATICAIVTFLIPSVFGLSLERTGLSRLSYLQYLPRRDQNAFSDGNATVGIGVGITDYLESVSQAPANGSDAVWLRISATANTRRILQYYAFNDSAYYNWHDKDIFESGSLNLIGHNSGGWVYMDGLTARFYGCGNSAEYTQIYVTSNGVLGFLPKANFTYPYFNNLTANPTTFVAPFWRDLEPQGGNMGNITYGLVYHSDGGLPIECFCVSWNGVRDKIGRPQTFQVLIENAPENIMRVRQSRVWFQYKSVTPEDDHNTTVGIENQDGSKMTSWNSLSIRNSESIEIAQPANDRSALINTLTIKLTANDANSLTAIDANPGNWRGYNLNLNTTAPPPPDTTYKISLDGSLTVLEWALNAAGFVVPGGEILWGLVPIGLDLVQDYALNQQQSLLLKQHIGPDTTTNATAHATTINGGLDSNAADASFDIMGWWIFKEPDNMVINHSLTVTAQLGYIDYGADGFSTSGSTIQTSVTLNLNQATNDRFSRATQLVTPTSMTYDHWIGGSGVDVYDVVPPRNCCDCYKLNVPKGWAIDVYALNETLPINPSRLTLQLNITFFNAAGRYRGGTTSFSNNQFGECINNDSSGYWYVKICAGSNEYGFYQLWVDIWNAGAGPPGGGCPFVSTWNGGKYVLDNNLLPKSELLGGTDVTDYYMLQQSLTQNQNGTYSLLLSEFQKEHDFFDSVRLMTVDHSMSTNIAVSSDGQVLTYGNPCPAVSAFTNENKDVTGLLGKIDGDYYQGYNGSYVTLNFGNLDISHGAKLVMRADNVHKESIHVQTQNATGGWHDVAIVDPRVNWATEIVDLSRYVSSTAISIKVRLCFTANHKLDFVGLDTTPQAKVKIQYARLISATHLMGVDVTSQLISNDQAYADLISEQAIQLSFLIPSQTTSTILTRSYIIVTEGHYFTMSS